jgi:hypothetical protein
MVADGPFPREPMSASRYCVFFAEPIRRKSADEKGCDQAMVKSSLAGSASAASPPAP